MKKETKQNFVIATIVIVIFLIFGTMAFRKQEPVKIEKTVIDTVIIETITPKIDSTEFYKDSIQIIKKYTSDPNSAGGVDLNIIWKNKSKRTIKYARFKVSAINAVDDEVYSEISVYDGPKWVTVTGPVKPNQVDGYGTYWSCVWYNHTIQKCKIRSVELEYMDGSKIEFTL